MKKRCCRADVMKSQNYVFISNFFYLYRHKLNMSPFHQICQNKYDYLILFLCALTALLMMGCGPNNGNKPEGTYSRLYDSLYNEVVYMDSLMEAGNLLLLENRLQQFKESEEAWLQAMDAPEYAWMSFWMAIFHMRLGHLHEAKQYSELAISRLDSLKMTPTNLTFITTTLNNAAGLEAEMGNYSGSVELLFRAMEYYKGDTINADVLSLYNNIGHNYNVVGDYELAAQYFERHRALAWQLGIEEEYGHYHRNMGELYYNTGRYEAGVDHMKQAVHHYRRLGQSDNEFYANTMLASNYTALNRVDEAEQLLRGNLQEAERLRLWEIYVETAISLFELHLAKGNEAAAFAAIEQGLSRIHMNNTARMQVKIYDRLISYYEQKGDFRQAYSYLTKRNSTADSVFNAEKGDFMREMTVKYETDRKNDQISQLELENERERRVKTVYLTGLVALVLIVLLIAGLLRRISTQKKALEEVNATKDRLFSIIAHDLRSPMIALQGMGDLINHHLRNGNREKLLQLGTKTGETLTRINHLLDNLLNWAITNSNRISYNPIEQDVAKLVEEALAVHQTAAEAKGIRLAVDVDAVRVWVDLNMAATVLRNLISNAIKYAPEGSEVTIGGAFDPDYYVLRIQDEGGGIPQEVIEALQQPEGALVSGGSKRGFGLGLRLAMYFAKKNYGRLMIRNEMKGALAEIYLPLTMRN